MRHQPKEMRRRASVTPLKGVAAWTVLAFIDSRYFRESVSNRRLRMRTRGDVKGSACSAEYGAGAGEWPAFSGMDLRENQTTGSVLVETGPDRRSDSLMPACVRRRRTSAVFQRVHPRADVLQRRLD